MKLLKLVPENTNLDFMRWRNVALVLSLIATVVSLSYTAYRGLNLGVDFVGGQLIRVSFAQPIDAEQLRAKIDSLHLGEASISEFGGPKTFQIRLPKPPGGDTAANSVATRVKFEVEKDYPGARIESVDTVSGKVSEELADNSAIAIALAMLGIAVYIWFRFEWQFGVGALLTLAHDIAMTLGFFAFTRLQVDLNVVAAFLTIVGYSLNDTVVIYDRIREDLRKYRKMAILPAHQPVAQRDAGADRRNLDHRADRARDPDADRARRSSSASPSRSSSASSSAPIRRSTFRRRCWSGSGSRATAS